MTYPKLILRADKKGGLKPPHPWILRRQIEKVKGNVACGDLVSIFSSDGKFVGNGYYNPLSLIAGRILSFDDEPITPQFIEKHIRLAFEKRKLLLNKTNAVRAVFSEADNLAGLIIDLYKDVVVFQVATFGMERLKKYILDAINSVFRPYAVYEKSDAPARKKEGLTPLCAWHSEEKPAYVDIFEGPLTYRVNIKEGHKTGFYLDQRNSRLAIKEFVKDKKVLDLFCYTGGFAIASALYGAHRVLGIDIKEQWLKEAQINAGINKVGNVVQFKRADAFNLLTQIAKSNSRYDVIILDPPSFLKSKHNLSSAVNGYYQINKLAMLSLAENGVLCSFCCSHHLHNELFSKIIKEAARGAHKTYAILKRCHQAPDHAIVKAIPQTEYLKGYFLRSKNL